MLGKIDNSTDNRIFTLELTLELGASPLGGEEE